MTRVSISWNREFYTQLDPPISRMVIGLATALCFALAQPIAKFLGKTGINIMTRLMGLILTALAVELIAEGLHKLFPILAH